MAEMPAFPAREAHLGTIGKILSAGGPPVKGALSYIAILRQVPL